MQCFFRNKRSGLFVVLLVLTLVLAASLMPEGITVQAAPHEEMAAQGTEVDGRIQSLPAYPAADAAVLGEAVWTSCTPTAVATYPSRIHVRCAAAESGIYYFALSTVDASHTARTLSILSAAHISGKTLNILYDPADTSGSQIGCGADNCRLIQAVEME